MEREPLGQSGRCPRLYLTMPEYLTVSSVLVVLSLSLSLESSIYRRGGEAAMRKALLSGSVAVGVCRDLKSLLTPLHGVEAVI